LQLIRPQRRFGTVSGELLVRWWLVVINAEWLRCRQLLSSRQQQPLALSDWRILCDCASRRR
jgi:hypothetical protein